MRTLTSMIAGAAFCLAFGPTALVGVAHADPAYSADKVLNIFLKDKAAAAEAKAAGKTRAICFGAADECPTPPSQAATRFDLLVNFEFNSDKLSASAKENLAQFAKALLDPRLKDQKFEIDGHTDATGAEQYNLGLSERRAKAAIAFLATQGVDTSKLVAKGFGDTKPRVADKFNAENRRVETHLAE